METSQLRMSVGSVEIFDGVRQEWTKRDLTVATHWEMATTLTFNKAASLAVGIDPGRVDIELEKHLSGQRHEFEDFIRAAAREGLVEQPKKGEIAAESLRSFLKERNI